MRDRLIESECVVVLVLILFDSIQKFMLYTKIKSHPHPQDLQKQYWLQ